MRTGKMKVSLPYDDGVYDLDLQGREDVQTIGSRFPEPCAEPERAVLEAMERTVGTPPLRELVPARGAIAVLVSDPTRGSGRGVVLPRLLSCLEQYGAGPDRVTIYIALGMHRGVSGEELDIHLGSEVRGRYAVVQHDATALESLVEVGTTPAGTVCRFNGDVARAALVICIGTVSFHYFAGFGGARKLILPGVAGEETILSNHRLSLCSDPGDGLSEACGPAILDGNPVHVDMLAGARLIASPVLVINTVYDDGGRLVFINAGDLENSHREGCAFLVENFRVPIGKRFRTVIVSAGGFPKDINLLQSHKAIRYASSALSDGGTMIAVAACREGIGSPSYRNAFERGIDHVPDVVRERYMLNSQTAMSTHELNRRYTIYLKSELGEDDTRRCGFKTFNAGMLNEILEGISSKDILIIQNGSSFLPDPC